MFLSTKREHLIHEVDRTLCAEECTKCVFVRVTDTNTVSQVWVSSPHNATGYYTVYGEEALHADHFNTKLSFGDTQTVWARTGYLGFLRRTELTDASGGECCVSLTGGSWKALQS